jgi:hypothetical protein
MSVKQEILRLARAAGLQKPRVTFKRIKGGNYWNLFAENPYREDWDGNPREEVVSCYFDIEHARKNLPGEAQAFIEKIKREALKEF